ncbi:hypothetical protein A2U01_0072985, partial [Trifolium medium]|nr:hypothetical protein [Trifolium medium]
AARHSRPGSSQPAREPSHRGVDRRKGDRSREPRVPPSTIANYTPLNKSHEAILAECNSSEFTKAGVKFLKQTSYKPGQDKSRYCR